MKRDLKLKWHWLFMLVLMIVVVALAPSALAQVHYYDLTLERDAQGKLSVTKLDIGLSDTGLSTPYPGDYTFAIRTGEGLEIYTAPFGFAERTIVDVFEEDRALRGSSEPLDVTETHLEIPYTEMGARLMVYDPQKRPVLEVDLSPYAWKPGVAVPPERIPPKMEIPLAERLVAEEKPAWPWLLVVVALILIIIGVVLKRKTRRKLKH